MASGVSLTRDGEDDGESTQEHRKIGWSVVIKVPSVALEQSNG